MLSCVNCGCKFSFEMPDGQTNTKQYVFCPLCGYQVRKRNNMITIRATLPCERHTAYDWGKLKENTWYVLKSNGNLVEVSTKGSSNDENV